MNDAQKMAAMAARIAALEAENARLTASLEARKLIEKAKGLLMRRHAWTEARAYRELQTASMRRRTPMAALAAKVLEGREVLAERDGDA